MCYFTSEAGTLENAQPLLRDFPRGKVAFTYNGNILNFREIEEMLQEETNFHCQCDSQCFLELVALYAIKRGDIIKALQESMEILSAGKIRFPNGYLRPDIGL